MSDSFTVNTNKQKFWNYDLKNNAVYLPHSFSTFYRFHKYLDHH